MSGGRFLNQSSTESTLPIYELIQHLVNHASYQYIEEM
jgi:hypothetical protein